MGSRWEGGKRVVGGWWEGGRVVGGWEGDGRVGGWEGGGRVVGGGLCREGGNARLESTPPAGGKKNSPPAGGKQNTPPAGGKQNSPPAVEETNLAAGRKGEEPGGDILAASQRGKRNPQSGRSAGGNCLANSSSWRKGWGAMGRNLSVRPTPPCPVPINPPLGLSLTMGRTQPPRRAAAGPK